jgi:ribonuclease Z
MEGRKLGRLRKEGVTIEDVYTTQLLAYTGDTILDPVLECEEVLRCALVVLECTYLDDAHSVECARERGHIHLDEVIRNASAFAHTGHLLFMHISQVYSNEEVRRIFRDKLPASLLAKSTVLLPCSE